MTELTRYFKGLADPTRLRILNLLLHGELCGCDIQRVIGTAQPNVSRHLACLKHAGLVQDRRVGYRIFYALSGANAPDRRELFRLLRVLFRRDRSLQDDSLKLRRTVRTAALLAVERRPVRIRSKVAAAPQH